MLVFCFFNFAVFQLIYIFASLIYIYYNQIIMRKSLLLTFLMITMAFVCHGQISVQNCRTGRYWNADSLVRNVMLGNGVNISNVKFNNSTSVINCNNIGTFTTGPNPTNLGISEGIIISTGNINGAVGPNLDSSNTTAPGCNITYRDQVLANDNGISTSDMYDCATLEFDFVPRSDHVEFRFVFASEEYPDYVGNSFNDRFGFFITSLNSDGLEYDNMNIALMPNGDNISINNVNSVVNSNLYVSNPVSSTSTIEYNGFTVVLTAEADVVPCSTYHMRISLTDIGDANKDSGVFLEANSLSSNMVFVTVDNPSNPLSPTYIYEGCCANVIFRLADPTSDRRTLVLSTSSTATSGVEYNAVPTTRVFPAGQDTVIVPICAILDGISEGTERIYLDYTIQGGCSQDMERLTLRINNVNNLTVTASATENSQNETANLTCNTTGGSGNLTYLWTDLSNGTHYTTRNVNGIQLNPIRQLAVCVTDRCGTTVCDTVTIGQTERFLYASNDTTICLPNNPNRIYIHASGADRYEWYRLPNISNTVSTTASVQTPVLNANQSPYRYLVKGYKTILGREYMQLDTVIVYAVQKPVITVSNTDGCPGESVTVSATGAAQYSWDAPGNYSTTNTHTYNPNQPIGHSPALTAYTVYGVSADGMCVTEKPFVVNVLPEPTVTITANRTDICPGESVHLTASSFGGEFGAQYFKWGGTLPQRTNSERYDTVRTFYPTENTHSYIVIGANRACYSYDTIDITIHDPAFTLEALPDRICFGDSAHLQVHGPVTNTYRWTANGQYSSDTNCMLYPNVSFNNYNGNYRTVTYTVTGRADLERCTTTRTVTVRVYRYPIVSIPDSVGICDGNSALIPFTHQYGWLYNYTGHSNYMYCSSSGSDNIFVSPGVNTSYIVDVAGADSVCHTYDTVSVYLYPHPSVQITTSGDTICMGQSATLSASGAYSYYVSGGGFSTNGYVNQNSWTVTPSTTTTYTIIGRDSNNLCETMVQFTVVVLDLPSITLTTNKNNICEGDSVLLTAHGANRYSWDGQQTFTTVSSMWVHPPLPTGGSNNLTTLYTVIGESTGATRCSNMGAVNITVHTYPTVTLQTDDTLICRNDTVTLTAHGADLYQWVAGESYVINSTFNYFPTGDTSIVVFGSNGSSYGNGGVDGLCISSDTIDIRVMQLPNVVLSSSTYENCSGDSVTLTATGALSYSWNGRNGNYTTDSVLLILPGSGNYNLFEVFGIDSNGCKGSDTARVLVHTERPNIVLVANRDTICSVDTVRLTASGATSYSWDRGQTYSTVSQMDFNLSGDSTITIYGTNGYGCPDSTSITITVYQMPTVRLTPNQGGICIGDSIRVEVHGAARYQWDGEQGFWYDSVRYFSPSVTTTYAVTGEIDGPRCQSRDSVVVSVYPLPVLQLTTSATGVCSGDSVTFTATGIHTNTFKWGNGFVTDTSYTFMPDTTRSYTIVTKSIDGCADSGTLNVAVWFPHIALDISDTAICLGDTITVTASLGNTYSFENNSSFSSTSAMSFVPDSSHTYIVYAHDEHQCEISDSISVAVYYYPVTHVEARRLECCAGDRIWLFAQGAEVYKYTWARNFFNGDTSIAVEPQATTTYVVIGATANELCQTSDSVTIVAYPLPDVHLSTNAPDVCEGDTITITASGADSYSWDFGWTFTDDSTFISVPHVKTTYFVWGEEHTHYCMNFDTISVWWYDHPQLSISSDRSEICAGDSVVITAGGANFYQWNGDTTHTSTNFIVLSPDSTTTVNVTGDLRDHYFCTSDTSITITVYALPEVELVADKYESCTGDTVTLTASGAAHYRWYYDTTYTDNSIKLTAPRESSRYIVEGRIDNMLCASLDTVNITVYAPEVRITADRRELCDGESVSIELTGSDNYMWHGDTVYSNDTLRSYVLHSDTTLYFDGETSNHLCTNRDSMSFIVYPIPDVRLTIEQYMPLTIIYGTDVYVYELCRGERVLLHADGATYYRFLDDTTLTTANRLRIHPQADTAMYVLYGENFNHMCHQSDTIQIIVNPLPVITSEVSSGDLCAGDSTTITMHGGLFYRWHEDSLFVTDSVMTVAPIENTQYIVCGENEYLCHAYDTILVNAFPVPVVSITASDTVICFGDSVLLTATGATDFLWGDDTVSTTRNTLTIKPQSDTTITVIGNNGGGLCSDTASISITVLPLPTIQLQASKDIICVNDSVTLTATGDGIGYAWNGGQSGNDSIITIYPHGDTMIWVGTTATNGCQAFDTVSISFRSMPNIAIVGPNEICLGDTVTLTATGGDLFMWDNDTQYSSVNQKTVSPTADTMFVLRGVDRDPACRNSDTLHISVYTPPTVYLSATPSSLCAGDTVSLMASGADEYVWMDDDTTFTTSNRNTYVASTTTGYVVTGYTHNRVCHASDTAMLNVIQAPNVTLTATDTVVCVGAEITVSANGAESYAWQGNSIFGNDSTMTVQMDSTMTFTVIGRIGSEGCSAGSSMTVRVVSHTQPAAVFTPQRICLGDSTTLHFNGAYHYSIDGGATFTTDSIITMTPTQSDSYLIIGCGIEHACFDTTSVNIIVDTLPVVNLTSNNDTICQGNNVVLTASGANTYAWNGSSTYGNSPTETVTPSETTTYYVYGRNTNGCIGIDSITVNVSQLPAVVLTASSTEICNGDSIILTATGADSYFWHNVTGVNNIVVYPTTNTTYIVSGTNSDGCSKNDTVTVTVNPVPQITLNGPTQVCDGSSYTLHVSGANQYSWHNTSNFSSSDSLTATIHSNTTVVVYGRNNNSNCYGNATIDIEKIDNPTVEIQGTSLWCEGDEVLLRAEASNGTSVLWTSSPEDNTLFGQTTAPIIHVTPSQATTYSVQATLISSPYCTSAVAQIDINFEPRPVLTLEISEDSVCEGDQITVTAHGADLYSLNYSQNYNEDSVFILIPAHSSNIIVIGSTGDRLCSTMDSVWVNVFEKPTIAIDGDDSSCIGYVATLRAISTHDNFTWRSEPQDITLQMQVHNSEITVAPVQDTRYYVVVENGACHVEAAKTLLVGPMPSSYGVSDPPKAHRGETNVNFIDLSVNAKGRTWIFPDGYRSSDERIPYNIPADIDSFAVTLIAYNGGCRDTSIVEVDILDDELWAPNAFTPGESNNNLFFVKLHNIDNFHMDIYNRQGVLVFSTDDMEEGWDGNYKGQPCPQAAYVYIISAEPKGKPGESFHYKGSFLLLR